MLCYMLKMAHSLRITQWLLPGVLFVAAMDGRMPVLAQSSPLDDYYKRQSSGGAQAAPVDNDEYYYAPGQYIDKYYGTPGQYTPPAKSAYQSCNSIGDSPSCLGD